ncbi:hypothetical protein NDR87_17180 [Nocardia sp. CDC159]|uniref:DUF8020 domain-containing protein n=1 Tax=Nocardia pulmonis TaxID=2951408 RepID=A0A9X2J0G9_9NOCA|nr:MULTISPECIES: hypothetical protein [Nocardia]MCM6775931.1 hypothetical protein [Nocardia pulmonis]MCM6788093.1 hypothetical protein [Nocardia sp. CDC159]
MRIKKIAVAAMCTIAATGIAGSVAHAESAPTPASALPDAVRGVEHGVTFEVSKSADGKSLAASLVGGMFSVTDNAVNVADRTGAVFASMPLTVELEQGAVELRPRVDATGTHLTAEPIGYWQQSSPRERSIWAGAALGGFIGALIGMAIGIVGGPLVLVTGFAGALIGGALGAGIVAAVPNSDVPDRWSYVVPDRPTPGSWEDCHGINPSFLCD